MTPTHEMEPTPDHVKEFSCDTSRTDRKLPHVSAERAWCGSYLSEIKPAATSHFLVDLKECGSGPTPVLLLVVKKVHGTLNTSWVRDPFPFHLLGSATVVL